MPVGTPSITHTEATVLLACQSALRANLATYLTALGTARGRTYTAPESADVFITDEPSPNHGWPAVGLHLDGSSRWESTAGDVYEVETPIRIEIATGADSTDAETPEEQYIAAIDYAHAAAACLARYLPAQTVGGSPVGIGRCDVESTDAQPSVWEDPDDGWVIRVSEARVLVYWQTLQEVPEP